MIPEGFAPLGRLSPVIEMIGPVYRRGEGAGLVLGLRAERLAFANCYIGAEGQRVARASAVFAVMGTLEN